MGSAAGLLSGYYEDPRMLPDATLDLYSGRSGEDHLGRVPKGDLDDRISKMHRNLAEKNMLQV